MKARFINPFTDYGFKKIFGEEASKPCLIDFLNAVLGFSDRQCIRDINFRNNEQLPESIESRKVIFDIYCENERGEKIIVELQKARQNFFKERTIYYSTFPIREQVEKGDWDFDLKSVYCVGILDFTFRDYEDESENGNVIHRVSLKDQDGRLFYKKLHYVYLEMPNFNKTDTELVTRLDKWLFFIKNLEDLQMIPSIFSGDMIFHDAFSKAELSHFTQEEYTAYELSLKGYRDWFAVIKTAKMESRNEAILNIAKTMLTEGLPFDVISRCTGLSIEEIKELDN